MAALIVLAVVAVALVLFWTEWVPVEVTSLVVVCLLATTGVLTPSQAFAGFSNDTVVFIFTLLAMTQGLAATGVVRVLGERLTVIGRRGRRTFVLGLLLVVASFSAFVSNTVTAAAFLPVAVSGAERLKVPKREVLLPMAYASMLGGTILLFGTSTNLVMSAAMARSGLAPIGITELAPMGLPIAALGLLATALLIPLLLRKGGRAGGDATLPERAYLAQVAVPAGSPHVGRALADVGPVLGARPVGVVRGGEALSPDPARLLAPEDRVVVEGRREEITGAAHAPGVSVDTARPADAPAVAHDPADAGAGEPALVIVEASVPPGSRLAGRTLEELGLGDQLGLEVLGIHRRPTVQRFTKLQLLARARRARPLASLPVAPGDLLLLRGTRERVAALADGALLVALTGVEEERPRRRKALLALALFAGALGLGSSGLVPLSVAGLCGMVLMLLTGCVDSRRAFRVDWRVVLLIGAMLALGDAMERSGAGEILGEALAGAAGGGGPRAALVALMALTIVLSAPMSNQAAALVMLPVALGAAAELGVDPRPFAIGITLAGSLSFVTPLEPASMLVYGVGRYRFVDFVRVGTPLTLALLALLAFGVPILWPFTR